MAHSEHSSSPTSPMAEASVEHWKELSRDLQEQLYELSEKYRRNISHAPSEFARLTAANIYWNNLAQTHMDSVNYLTEKCEGLEQRVLEMQRVGGGCAPTEHLWNLWRTESKRSKMLEENLWLQTCDLEKMEEKMEELKRELVRARATSPPTAPPSLLDQRWEQLAWPVQERCNCTKREINSPYRVPKGMLCERMTCHKAIPPSPSL